MTVCAVRMLRRPAIALMRELDAASEYGNIRNCEDRRENPPRRLAWNPERRYGKRPRNHPIEPEHAGGSAESSRDRGDQQQFDAQRIKDASGAAEDAAGEIGQPA